MIVLAIDPGLSLGWASNAKTSFGKGAVNVPALVAQWFRPERQILAKDDLLARRLAAVDRWLDDAAQHLRPDLFVVERQLAMAGRNRVQVNQHIETVVTKVAGDRDALLRRPTPSEWQAWAQKSMPIRFAGWKGDGKPDDISAELMLKWALATQTVEVA